GDAAAGTGTSQADPGSPPPQPPPTPPPTPAEEDLSYYSRLEGRPGEPPKPESAAARPAAAPTATPEKSPKAEKAAGDTKAKPLPPPRAVAAVVPGEPPGQGYAMRVAAYKGRAQAEALAARLAAKGYGTWIVQLPATTTGPALYSVRVGKYKTNKEADAAMRRLRKEEKLKPSLITR
ncbi:MAG: SPOR domain-containing protein, partial [Acidobacteria bacterium]